jgi:hypothetical protein
LVSLAIDDDVVDSGCPGWLYEVNLIDAVLALKYNLDHFYGISGIKVDNLESWSSLYARDFSNCDFIRVGVEDPLYKSLDSCGGFLRQYNHLLDEIELRNQEVESGIGNC